MGRRLKLGYIMLLMESKSDPSGRLENKMRLFLSFLRMDNRIIQLISMSRMVKIRDPWAEGWI